MANFGIEPRRFERAEEALSSIEELVAPDSQVSADLKRALREIALGRKAWLIAASDRGGHRAAFMYTLIVKPNMNSVDPQVWLADVLARIAEHLSQRLGELLPCNWKKAQAADTLGA